MINEDYNDFVSLSTKLVNVDSSLQRMQAPLLELQARVPAAARVPAVWRDMGLRRWCCRVLRA